MTDILIGMALLIIAFCLWIWLFPTKKYMSDIYQEMYIKQDKQEKLMKDMRNVFFAKNRKFKKGDK